MRDNSGVEYPSEALWALTVLGALLPVFLFGFAFLVGGISADQNTETFSSLAQVRNFDIGGQLVGMIFWSFFILLGGIVWTRAFFRKLSVAGIFTIASAIGLFFASIPLAVASFLLENGGKDEVALLIAGLTIFAVLGLLGLIIREIIAAALA